MLSPLFIQLFGREVIDRLSLSGFNGVDTLARTSPEQLAEDAGIPVALARRIVALAVESGDPALMDEIDAPDAASDPGWSAMLPDGSRTDAGQAAASGATQHPVSAAPPESGGSSEAHVAASAPAAAEDERRITSHRPAEEDDPFIDQAGLVSWMGFAARATGGDSRTWSVDDAILDRSAGDAPDEVPGDAPPDESVETAAPSVENPTESTVEDAAAPADRPAPTRPPMLLSDSLWSFGRFEDRAPHGEPHHEPESSGDRGARPRPRSHPRRRKRDA